MQTILTHLAHSPIYAEMGARLLGARAWAAIYLDRGCIRTPQRSAYSNGSWTRHWHFFYLISNQFFAWSVSVELWNLIQRIITVANGSEEN